MLWCIHIRLSSFLLFTKHYKDDDIYIRILVFKKLERLSLAMYLQDRNSKAENCKQIGARGYKKIFMLNSVEHEILNAHK